MENVCIIKQPAGLGDVLFTMKIAVTILARKRASKIIWPINSVYHYIGEYIKIPGVEFVDEAEDFEGKEVYSADKRGAGVINNILFINLHRADEVILTNGSNKPMYCKYEMVGLDFHDWHDFVKIERNYGREKKLEDFINPAHPFKLVNRVFCTYPDIQIAPIPLQDNEVQIVKLEFDNIFDWCGLLEQCQEFHTVETSFCYLAKILGTRNVFVYPRNRKSDFKYISKAYPENWKYLI